MRVSLLLSNFDQYQLTDVTEVLSYQNLDHRFVSAQKLKNEIRDNLK